MNSILNRHGLHGRLGTGMSTARQHFIFPIKKWRFSLPDETQHRVKCIW